MIKKIVPLAQSAIITEINAKFKGPANRAWAFSNERSIDLWTHGYHRYPAKFIPQVVKKLLETYTKQGDRVADVFAGCGTTLVECKLHGLPSIGVDINPVAQLITKAKINPVSPVTLEKRYKELQTGIQTFIPQAIYAEAGHERIDYWFKPEQKNKIAFLYSLILLIQDRKEKDFFLCALSNILKNCSTWLQSSTKPQTDKTKKIPDPFKSFQIQVKKMLKRNRLFYENLKEQDVLSTPCKIKIADARKTNIQEGSVNAIITSPPYVTSYEYADIHQLTGYWFEYITDLSSFRKKFIGTFYSQNKELVVKSKIATGIISDLSKQDTRLAGEVANYFNDMYDVATEMNRILAPNGFVCMVVGNTTLRNVKVKSAQAFAEILRLNNFRIEQVIKRKITNKQIPTIRDNVNGKFTKLNAENSKKVYPNEYIIIARKPRRYAVRNSRKKN